MARKRDIAALLGMISNAYAGFEVKGQAQMELWQRALADCESELLRAALERHIMSNKWPPTIAELRQRVVELLDTTQGMTATEAWGMVLKALRQHGHYGAREAKESLHPKVWAVARDLGWSNLCMSTNPTSDRARFIEAWNTISDRDRQQALLPASHRNGALAFDSTVKMLAEKLRVG